SHASDFVFFSSRRRHTRFSRDWSSDVCSSDLDAAAAAQIAEVFTEVVVARAFSEEAVELLTRKKNIRLLRAPAWAPAELELKPIDRKSVVQGQRERVGRWGDLQGVEGVTGERA